MAMTLEDAERVFGRSHGRLRHRDFEGRRLRAAPFGLPGWVPVAAAASVGLVGGMALFGGRRLAHRAAHALPGDWLAQLAAEHRVIDYLLRAGAATTAEEPQRRGLVLARLAYLVLRQAVQKEAAVYPALREDGNGGAAKSLAADQFDVKSALYAVWEGDRAGADWARAWRALDKLVRDLSAEEERVLPPFHQKLGSKANARLTRAMNREGDRLA